MGFRNLCSGYVHNSLVQVCLKNRRQEMAQSGAEVNVAKKVSEGRPRDRWMKGIYNVVAQTEMEGVWMDREE